MFIPNEPEDKIPDWTDALVEILAPYDAVANLKESDYQLSTDDILESLRRHTGNFNIPPAAVIESMKDLGFRYENTGGAALEWLLKKKKH